MQSRSSPEPRRPRAGFPRAARITAQSHFDRVYQQGRKFVAPSVVAWALPSPSGRSRIGLSVSRKVGGAIVRNRVKRVLREAFRQLEAPPDPPIDLVLVARPGRAPQTLADARTALEQVLRRWNAPPSGGS
jgi:ribonuclease P protein component